MRSIVAELVADTGCGLGESPFWDPDSHSLSWLDIDASRLHSYSASSALSSRDVENETTFSAVVAGGGILEVHAWGIDLIDSDGSRQQVVEPWLDPTLSRTNDGAIDSRGRLWVGSTTRDRQPNSGGIGVVVGGVWHEVMSGLTLPNGIGWSPDDATIYYVDTLDGTVWAGRFDVETASVTSARPFFTIERDVGLADGLAVDVDGGVWIAVWGGGCVLHLDPSGAVVETVEVGAPKATSCAFAGKTLFITTANPDGSDPPGSGGLYAVDVGIEGVPVPPAHLR